MKVVPGEHFVGAGKFKFAPGDVLYPEVLACIMMYYQAHVVLQI